MPGDCSVWASVMGAGRLHLALLVLLSAVGAHAGGIRERMRPVPVPDTEVSETQAAELTLTLVRAAPQALQTWVRTAARIDDASSNLVARPCFAAAALIRAGQRVRAFPPDSKSSIYRATVTRVEPQGYCARVEASLSGPTYEKSPYYVMEIIVQRGVFLSIPNEAIIEEGGRQIVYVQRHPGHYMAREIHTGLTGELYTQVHHGLNEGDQVVTLGSFFIDAEHKLKATRQGGTGHAHMHH